jgi:hypothetical protein
MIVHVFLLLLLFAVQAVERCGQCGMDLSGFRKTQYEIQWTDGTVTKTCGVQCGLTQQILRRDRFKASIAKDYLAGVPFDARTGYYVFEGKIIADMAPGFIAFRLRADAEKFQKVSGGRVLSFGEALSVWTERKARR